MNYDICAWVPSMTYRTDFISTLAFCIFIFIHTETLIYCRQEYCRDQSIESNSLFNYFLLEHIVRNERLFFICSPH